MINMSTTGKMKILAETLDVKSEPSINSEIIAQYKKGEIINSGHLIIKNEDRYWLRYMGSSGNYRYVCAIEKDGTKNIEDFIDNDNETDNNEQHNEKYSVGCCRLPLAKYFSDFRIKRWGDCFLCTCIKGGLTTKAQCEDCFNWGINSGKLRNTDCYVNCDKEAWAREISQRYGTPYHGDYIFQKNHHHFWLTRDGMIMYDPYYSGMI